MKVLLNKIAILLFFSTIMSPGAMAINVIPFSGELDLSQKSSYKIKINNPKSTESAVKISVFKWTIDKHGNELREPSNDLIIFPRQMLIAANSGRSIRVSTRDGLPPTYEKAYRIVVEQLPLKSRPGQGASKGASINVLTRYVTSFYVKPRKSVSQIKVTKARAINKGFKLEIKNIGNAHTHFIQPVMTIEQEDNIFTIDSLEDLHPFARTNILASGFRSYEWQFPESYKDQINVNKPFNVNLKWTCENCEKQTDQISFLVN